MKGAQPVEPPDRPTRIRSGASAVDTVMVLLPQPLIFLHMCKRGW